MTRTDLPMPPMKIITDRYGNKRPSIPNEGDIDRFQAAHLRRQRREARLRANVDARVKA